MLKMSFSLSNTDIDEKDFVSLTSYRNIYDLCGETEISVIAEFLDTCMRLAGFPQYGKGQVFLESVDDEEYTYLLDCLNRYRKKRERSTT